MKRLGKESPRRPDTIPRHTSGKARIATGGLRSHRKRLIASIIVTAHAAPKIATNNRSPATTQDHNRRQRALRARPALASEGPSTAVSSRTYFESAPTVGDSNRRPGLAITQFAGRVMADTIVAKNRTACP
jgi:hypothetical protein